MNEIFGIVISILVLAFAVFRGSEQGAQMNWKQKTQMKTTKQDSKRESNSTIELAFMRLLVAVLKLHC